MDDITAAREAARRAAADRDRLHIDLMRARRALRAIWRHVGDEDGSPCNTLGYQAAIELVKREMGEE